MKNHIENYVNSYMNVRQASINTNETDIYLLYKYILTSLIGER